MFTALQRQRESLLLRGPRPPQAAASVSREWAVTRCTHSFSLAGRPAKVSYSIHNLLCSLFFTPHPLHIRLCLVLVHTSLLYHCFRSSHSAGCIFAGEIHDPSCSRIKHTCVHACFSSAPKVVVPAVRHLKMQKLYMFHCVRCGFLVNC